jgi:hypothetical protein
VTRSKLVQYKYLLFCKLPILLFISCSKNTRLEEFFS